MIRIAPAPRVETQVITSCTSPRRRDAASKAMSDTAWLILALAAGLLVAFASVLRERAIHRVADSGPMERRRENDSDSWPILRPSGGRARRR